MATTPTGQPLALVLVADTGIITTVTITVIATAVTGIVETRSRLFRTVPS
jgi:hypothetical protein